MKKITFFLIGIIAICALGFLGLWKYIIFSDYTGPRSGYNSNVLGRHFTWSLDDPNKIYFVLTHSVSAIFQPQIDNSKKDIYSEARLYEHNIEKNSNRYISLVDKQYKGNIQHPFLIGPANHSHILLTNYEFQISKLNIGTNKETRLFKDFNNNKNHFIEKARELNDGTYIACINAESAVGLGPDDRKRVILNETGMIIKDLGFSESRCFKDLFLNDISIMGGKIYDNNGKEQINVNNMLNIIHTPDTSSPNGKFDLRIENGLSLVHIENCPDNGCILLKDWQPINVLPKTVTEFGGPRFPTQFEIYSKISL